MSRRTPQLNPWARESQQLAARITRRARWSRVLPGIALGLGLAAALVILLRLQGLEQGLDSRWLLLAGAALGLLWGLKRARGVPPADAGAAAWALDRRAAQGERGLAAAVLDGPVGAEVRHAEPQLPPPPRVRLAPPKGLLVLGAAGLLALLAVLVPPPEAVATQETTPLAQQPGEGRASDAAGTGEEAAAARELAERARRAEAVRSALGLRGDERTRPEAMAKALQDPTRRDAARRAAENDEALQAAIERAARDKETDAAGAAALADALGDPLTDQAELAAARRRAAVLRLRAGHTEVPPARRGVVERYFAARSRATTRGASGD